ncbi:MAG: GntR family transcriptional regulator [Proteobacteria bacterium]|nr:GntR family transcriptional regulator [Pseudomonadota bacterium]
MQLASAALSRDRAYGRLRDLILGAEFDLERPLSERGLASILGMGRMPVREALKNLARDGLLAVVPGRGTFVRQLSLDEVREIYEVRHAVEGMAAFLAAQRGASAGLRAFAPRLKGLLRQGEAADVAEVQAVGWAFHDEMVRAAGNRLLASIYASLRLQTALALRLTREHDPARVRSTTTEHLSVLTAIEAGEPAEAERRMYYHLARAMEARVRIFARLKGHSLQAEGGGPG